MKKYIILLIAVIISFSCSEDLLEPFTPGVVTDEVTLVSNSTNVQQLLHDGLNTLTNRDEFVFTSIFTDEAAPGSNNGGQGVSGTTNYYNFQLESLSPIAANIWNSNYNATATFNLILKYVDKLIVDLPSQANTLRRQKADALVLRAFAHTKILAYFSTDLKNDNALAGIIAKERYEWNALLPRAKNSDYYAFVHKDLDDALAIYNSLPPAAHNPLFPGTRLANALKARLFMYRGDYTNAEIQANLVINSGLTLATAAQLPTVFHTHTSANTTEVIFKLRRTVQQNSQGTNLHNGWVSISNSRTGSPFYEVSRSLFNFLNPTNVGSGANDARAFLVTRAAGGTTGSLIDPNFATSQTPLSSDILVPFKHGGSGALTSANRFNPDFIQVRLSEMHFIVAEARAYANDFTGVATSLRRITDLRFTTPPAALVLTSRAQALRAILDERRKELCFEGHRFIDLKRLSADANVTSFDRHPIDYNGLGFPGANPANFTFANNPKWALPIPQSETNANVFCVQNPGY